MNFLYNDTGKCLKREKQRGFIWIAILKRKKF